jgi:deferrochelatase/peroxidase EfeB
MALSRRTFLTTALAGGAAAAVTAACSGDSSASGSESVALGPAAPLAYVPFAGIHQTGITHPGNEYGLMASFTVTADTRDELADTFKAITTETKRIMEGERYDERDPSFPALYTGTVGNPPPPADLSIVTSVGASLFDGRYGLAAQKPRDLVVMPFLTNDKLDPGRSHGDVLLTISSAHEDVNLFALRQLMRATRGTMALHWMLDGYNRRTEAGPGEAGVRNLMGFVDGTANLHPEDGAVMDRYVWVQGADGEPAWAAGGSYHVVRVIRMFVEFWDRTKLSEQEALIGRRKADGAPLDGHKETDIPNFAADPQGRLTPLDAHIRLANPRTAETDTDLILRKGLSFSRGFDGGGRLDQGLAFVSYQRTMGQFLRTQARLKGEPLEEYIQPQGGGFFYALPGAPEGTWLGQPLFA